MELSEEHKLIHTMCNPHLDTELGKGVTYDKFIVYVKNFLAPFMEMRFIVEDYYKKVFDEIWFYKNCILQLPRGHSKTEMVGIWLTIYIADYQPINPYYYKYKGIKKRITQQTILAGASDDLNVWADRIKDFFYRSPILNRLKPMGVDKEKSSSKWNNKEMILSNGSTLHLRSIRGKNRGIHTDRVVADDLITESSTLTDKQTIEVWDGAIHGTTTTKEAMINVTGTPLRYTDIMFHLKNKPEGYYFKARPAIINEAKKIVLSPNRRSYADLMRIKREIGTTKFATEYMLNPIDDSVSLIKREHMISCLDKYFEGMWLKATISKAGATVKVILEKINYFEFRREQWDDIWVTGDFAFSDRKTADWTVFSYYGSRQGKIYKLGYIRAQGWSPNTQFAVLKALKDYFGVSMFGLEENSIKGVVKDVKHLNLPMKLFWMGNQDKAPTYKPEVPFSDKRWTISKINSIERLDASYENNKLVLPYKTELDIEKMDMQIEESISWALEEGKLIEIGRHPDIPITDILLNEMSQQPGGAYDFGTRKPIGDADYPEDDMTKRNMIKTQGIEGESHD